jgi:DNA replicative helicase MCM subunit Mcm2 (Cdc46/Mcm family)
MSEAHAKLCLREKVMRQDVLAAIGISEKFIKMLFDTDSFSSPNETKATSIDHYDAFMADLFKWYSKFTKDILEKM